MKKVLILKIFFLFALYLNAQDPVPVNYQRIVPSTPEASSLGKFGDIPVSYHSGVPQITVPIYSMKVGNFSLPISLDYHASGIKVSEISSDIGLGWALNAGGIISCVINGLPDVANGVLINRKYIIDSFKLTGLQGNSPGTFDHNIKKFIWNGEEEVMPDVFSFSLPDNSGKFSFDENNIARLIPFQKLKVEWVPQSYGFRITDKTGVIYEFFIGEGALVQNACNFSTFLNVSATQAWHLSKIILTNKEEIFIGGKELLIVKIKRFFPKLFGKIIRNQSPY